MVGPLQRLQGWKTFRRRWRRAGERCSSRQWAMDLSVQAGEWGRQRHKCRKTCQPDRTQLQPRAERHLYAGREMGCLPIQPLWRNARLRSRGREKMMHAVAAV